MPLSPAQIAQIRSEAEAAGKNADAVIAEVEKVMAEGSTEPTDEPEDDDEKDAKPVEQPPIFAYMLALFTANEVRETRGFGPTADGDLPCGKYIELHGGALAGSPKKTEDVPE